MPWADAASSKEAEGSRRVMTCASAWCIRSGKSLRRPAGSMESAAMGWLASNNYCEIVGFSRRC